MRIEEWNLQKGGKEGGSLYEAINNTTNITDCAKRNGNCMSDGQNFDNPAMSKAV